MNSFEPNKNSVPGKRRHGARILHALLRMILLVSVSFLLFHFCQVPKPANAYAAEVLPSAASVSPSPAPLVYDLRVFSSGGDLYAIVRDEQGSAAKPETFSFEIVYPDGGIFRYASEDDGTLYLNGLAAGLYTVRLITRDNITASPAPVSVPPRQEGSVSSSMYAPGWREDDGRVYYVNSRDAALTGLRQIGGKLHYFNQYGVKASKLGIDVSYHNRGINWTAVKANGIDFVVLRVGYRGYSTGLLWEDKRFVQYLRGAKAAGLDVGVYFYSSAVNPAEAVQEAGYVISLLSGIKLEYPVFFDTELSEDIPPGRHDYLGKAVRQQVIPAFCETIRTAGYTPGVYSNLNFLNNHIPYSTYGPYITWLASYTRENRLPNFSRPYDMWQFTAMGRVSGICGEADINVIF